MQINKDKKIVTPSEESSKESSHSANFNAMLPRTITSETNRDRLDKTATTYSGLDMSVIGQGSPTIHRNPQRRFYHPEFTTTAIYLPKDIKQKNRWRRWFFDHDEVVGTILELHAELPYGPAELELDDPYIKRQYQDCISNTKLFSMLPIIDLEYLKIGEVFLNTPWDNEKGMWSHIILHNPDYMEVTFTPFADQECIVELRPDAELKSLIHSTKPEDQQLKRRLPPDIVKRVLTGKNIILDSAEITHIARRSNPYDIRGTSIIDRLFRCFVPKTKVRMFDGSCKNIEDVVTGDKVLSKHGEKREVLDTVNYDIDDTIVEIHPEKSHETLRSTIGHEYLIRKAYCACGCGEELTYKQLKRDYKFLHGHNLKFNSSLIEDGQKNIITEPIYKVEKVESQNIKEGNCLLVPINNEIKDKGLTEGQGRLLGYFMAEGSFGNEETDHQSYIEWTFGLHEKETWAKDVVEILKKDFSISPNTYDGYNGKQTFSVKIVKKEDYNKIHKFLRENVKGHRSWNKEFTEQVLYYPKNIQKEILIGSFRGDAARNRNHTEALYASTSKVMAEQIQWLLFRCKFYNYIKHHDPKPRIIGSSTHVSVVRRYYTTIITGHYAKQFIKDCWNDYDEKVLVDTEIYDVMKEMEDKGYSQTGIAKELNESGRKGLEGGRFCTKTVKRILKNGGNVGKNYKFARDKIQHDDDYFYVPVKKVNQYKYTGKVYDITVGTNHWWLASGSFTTSNTLMYEDKLREAQITIADNFIYPLKVFKLGDPQKGWIPNESHQKALAQMLQQASMDPNFSLIYHYGLNIEYHMVSDKVMRLDPEWSEINNKKMIALGVSQEFMTGQSSYSSANVGLQTQLARYRAKRDLFEERWIKDKFFKGMAIKNEWYKRDKKEIVGQYRVTRKGKELEERLIIPELIWQKRLMLRDDQQYLTFMNQVYQNGKGPISPITLLQAMGLDLRDELKKKKMSKHYEKQQGTNIHPPVGGAGGIGGITAKIKNLNPFGFKDKKAEEAPEITDNEFIGDPDIAPDLVDKEAIELMEKKDVYSITDDLLPVKDSIWNLNLQSPLVPTDAVLLLTSFNNKLGAINKKYNGDIKAGISASKKEVLKSLSDLYIQGKITAYNWSDFLPIYKEHYAMDDSIKDYSDIILIGEFETWLDKLRLSKCSEDKKRKLIRNLGTNCYAYGQLKGFQEQGIFNVRISNSLANDGLRYKVSELLTKGIHMNSLISPKDEMTLFVPMIEGFDGDLGNSLEPHINRYKDFYIENIRVSKCPIEYQPQLTRYVKKLHKYFKAAYTKINFVKDISDLPEWAEAQKKIITEKFSSITEKKERDLMVLNSVNLEKLQKMGKIPIFVSGKTLHIATWIGSEDRSFVESFMEHTKDIFHSDVLLKDVKRAFKEINYNLNEDELQSYKIFGYIEPIVDECDGISGYKIKDGIEKNSNDVDERVIHGKIWDAQGKCINSSFKDSFKIFSDHVKIWIDYPHLLDDQLKNYFNNLN